MSRVGKRLHQEDGIALIVSLGVLTLVAIIATTALANSLLFAGDSNRNAGSTRALSVAEAGLQQARYRLNKYAPLNNECLLMDNSKPAASGGECPGVLGQTPFDLGNRSSYIYWVTDTGQGAQCGGQSGGLDRCIVSIGRADGQQRRVAIRATTTSGKNLFPNGITATKNFSIRGGASITGTIGTDTSPITFLGNSHNTTITGGCNVTYPPPYPANDPCTYTQTTPSCPPSPDHTFAACEDSVDTMDFPASKVSNSNNTPGKVSCLPGCYNAGATSATFPTGDLRALVVPNQGTVVLQSGDYNFCSITLGNGVNLALATPTTKVRIFIDSAARSTPDKGCSDATVPDPANYSPITLGNNASFNAGNPDASTMFFFIYGRGPAGSCTADFQNSPVTNIALVAPNCDVLTNNGGTWFGAIFARSFDANNSFTFVYDPHTAPPPPGSGGFYQRKFWTECKSVPPNANDPESGC